ncbi:ABC transporter ATP-binding protein [Paenibacillus sp. 1001270B_150601_E10]|uniref:ABC transporter ATP-binding protein n=1 Tax=Paenibacillus sp. 1001270B_150601_E10 TaxID=2787079 RepID=UPI00189E5419|nr:ATP-binding cassette domain-containing protein [Paenibacillus sp. 1001270B_150601_E10]
MNQPYLELQAISKSYGSFLALDRISLNVHQNEFVCLLGPSGCGKSTLLRLIAGLDSMNQGSIQLMGNDITHVAAGKRDFAMMFQSYALFPNMTAAQNIAYGLENKKWNKHDIKEKVKEVLELVNLSHVADKYPAQCSGGQQQRIALARALAMSPKILLLDEPLSALDANVREKLRYEIRLLHDKLGMTTIMVTHDQDEALTMADRIVVMNEGHILQAGSPQDIYEQPQSPFVAHFIGTMNFIPKWSPESSAENNVYAIRPEHVQLSRERKGGLGETGKIENIEFRGSFYRLTVRAMNQEYETILIDVSPQILHQLELKRSDPIMYTLPSERIITFGQQLRSAVNS